MTLRSILPTLLAAGLATPTLAHTLYVLPSHFVVSSDSSWITADISAANMTFMADKGVSPAGFSLYLPDGQVQQAAAVHHGKRKSMVDIELSSEGTYRLEFGGPARYITSYKINGDHKRLLADKNERITKLPAGAEQVQTLQSRSRAISFVTLKRPDAKVLALSGKGLELQSLLHPADIVAGEQQTITLLVEGKAQQGVTLELSFDGENYRDDAMRVQGETDGNGQFSFTPHQAGRYLLQARYSTDVASDKADRISEGLTWSFEAALP